jgi:hypothetical protein
MITTTYLCLGVLNDKDQRAMITTMIDAVTSTTVWYVYLGVL